ncbi:hypothetical protein KIPB_011052, partial [Kipferlia bialata]
LTVDDFCVRVLRASEWKTGGEGLIAREVAFLADAMTRHTPATTHTDILHDLGRQTPPTPSSWPWISPVLPALFSLHSAPSHCLFQLPLCAMCVTTSADPNPLHTYKTLYQPGTRDSSEGLCRSSNPDPDFYPEPAFVMVRPLNVYAGILLERVCPMLEHPDVMAQADVMSVVRGRISSFDKITLGYIMRALAVIGASSQPAALLVLSDGVLEFLFRQFGPEAQRERDREYMDKVEMERERERERLSYITCVQGQAPAETPSGPSAGIGLGDASLEAVVGLLGAVVKWPAVAFAAGSHSSWQNDILPYCLQVVEAYDIKSPSRILHTRDCAWLVAQAIRHQDLVPRPWLDLVAPKIEMFLWVFHNASICQPNSFSDTPDTEAACSQAPALPAARVLLEAIQIPALAERLDHERYVGM